MDTLTAYLCGEIHSDWREQIRSGLDERDLPVRCTGPVTDHERSDNCGERVFGPVADPFAKDQIAAGLNAIRARHLIDAADVIVVRFGPKYRQWNAAFEAGMAVALGKSVITLHDRELDHALKEVDRAALAVARTPREVVAALEYVMRGEVG
ncbi:MAG: YtoQ family protein [Myxococcales bacterium FL481]|nr:MAG: YtoQ family protein [Myxococcales bacterium FL481]